MLLFSACSKNKDEIEAIGNAGDVAIGITTSGNSENVLEGLKQSKKMKLKTIALCGQNTKKLEKLSDEIISIPAKNTSRIQEMHIMIGQMICNAIEKDLNLSKYVKSEI